MEIDPARLNREIAQLETELARVDFERKALAKADLRANLLYRYLIVARWLRRPAAWFKLWPLAVLAIGPLGLGLAILILVSSIAGLSSFAFGAFEIAVLFGFVLFLAILYRPEAALLEAAIQDIAARLQLNRSQLTEIAARRAALSEQLRSLVDERQSLAKGEKLQRGDASATQLESHARHGVGRFSGRSLPDVGRPRGAHGRFVL